MIIESVNAMSLYVLKSIVLIDDYDNDDEEESSNKGSFGKII